MRLEHQKAFAQLVLRLGLVSKQQLKPHLARQETPLPGRLLRAGVLSETGLGRAYAALAEQLEAQRQRRTEAGLLQDLVESRVLSAEEARTLQQAPRQRPLAEELLATRRLDPEQLSAARARIGVVCEVCGARAAPDEAPCAECGAPLPAEPPPLTPVVSISGDDEDRLLGRVLGGCRLERKLGQGGMGAVYLARHETLDVPVAVKVLPPAVGGSAEMRARFAREAQSVARLDHPGVVKVNNHGVDQQLHFIAMEFVDGESLADRLRSSGPLPIDDALRAAQEASEALAYAHGAGVFHRDIKPDNLLQTADGRTKVADFGLARMQDGSAISMTGAVLGTPAYMAPEQARGDEVDASVDVYALAITLFALLTGESPFKRDHPMACALATCEEPLPPIRRQRPDASAGLQALLGRMASKRASQRPTMAEVAAELARLRAGASSGPPQLGARDTRPSATRRPSRELPLRATQQQGSAPVPPAAILGGAAVLAAGMLLLAILIWPRSRKPAQAQLSSSSVTQSSRQSSSVTVSSISQAPLSTSSSSSSASASGAGSSSAASATSSSVASSSPGKVDVVAELKRLEERRLSALEMIGALRELAGRTRDPMALMIVRNQLTEQTRRAVDDIFKGIRVHVDIACRRGDFAAALQYLENNRREAPAQLRTAIDARAGQLEQEIRKQHRIAFNSKLGALRRQLASRRANLQALADELRTLDPLGDKALADARKQLEGVINERLRQQAANPAELALLRQLQKQAIGALQNRDYIRYRLVAMQLRQRRARSLSRSEVSRDLTRVDRVLDALDQAIIELIRDKKRLRISIAGRKRTVTLIGRTRDQLRLDGGGNARLGALEVEQLADWAREHLPAGTRAMDEIAWLLLHGLAKPAARLLRKLKDGDDDGSGDLPRYRALAGIKAPVADRTLPGGAPRSMSRGERHTLRYPLGAGDSLADFAFARDAEKDWPGEHGVERKPDHVVVRNGHLGWRVPHGCLIEVKVELAIGAPERPSKQAEALLFVGGRGWRLPLARGGETSLSPEPGVTAETLEARWDPGARQTYRVVIDPGPRPRIVSYQLGDAVVFRPKASRPEGRLHEDRSSFGIESRGGVALSVYTIELKATWPQLPEATAYNKYVALLATLRKPTRHRQLWPAPSLEEHFLVHGVRGGWKVEDGAIAGAAQGSYLEPETLPQGGCFLELRYQGLGDKHARLGFKSGASKRVLILPNPPRPTALELWWTLAGATEVRIAGVPQAWTHNTQDTRWPPPAGGQRAVFFSAEQPGTIRIERFEVGK